MASIIITALFCATVLSITFVVLLAMPNSKLREICVKLFQLVLAVFFAMLVVSPIDIIPDVFFPVGFIDDIGYLTAALASARAAVSDKSRAN